VPFEKTLEALGQLDDRRGRFKGDDAEWVVLMSEYLHEQTGLTAGTIADDDELATNLSHLDTGQEMLAMIRNFGGQMRCWMSQRGLWKLEIVERERGG
jgi:hypothetical protein